MGLSVQSWSAQPAQTGAKNAIEHEASNLVELEIRFR
jgi:hypothetical protein